MHLDQGINISVVSVGPDPQEAIHVAAESAALLVASCARTTAAASAASLRSRQRRSSACDDLLALRIQAHRAGAETGANAYPIAGENPLGGHISVSFAVEDQ